MEKRFAFVSGNVRGIGRDLTLRLIEMGYIVPIHYRNSQQEAYNFKEEIREKYMIDVPIFKADITDEKQVINLTKSIIQEYKEIDVLVNNVGDYLYKSILDITLDEWNYIINSNLTTSFLLTQNFLPYIRRRIIFVGFAGTDKVKAYPYTTAYNIAKTGVLIYAKSLAKVLANKGITVNVMGIGIAENSITKPIEEIPMRRTAYLREISDLFEFLVSDKADYITGQLIEIAGGWKL
ncbi:MAG: SDR family oxidoreductase [Candidatus Calescibacterium sp.]|nr:SDR family oxidoreductase [Candidatus Calescibacterium sp.]MCX7971807.1 SDR family oxidoreductase [bacterium]MDW8194921.1 SDR family oxidoreductase [Candidatus Calescibacterium sp.]